jgi:small-conductance mechanosensitive channel
VGRPNLIRDARPTVGARTSACPVQLAVPIGSAVVTITGTALVAMALGLSLPLVVAVTLAVALAGAVLARRTVTSLVTGVGLLLIRPYAPGERLLLPLPDAVVEAEVIRIGLVNTTLATPDGLLVVGNTYLLRGMPVATDAPRSFCR